MENNLAIEVKNLSKSFRIPHEKISTLKGEFVNAFKRKSYEEFKALDDVSFEVKKGEFFGIIGRNGSGKSTLLKILAGVYKSDGGRIKINGLISPFLELGIGFQPELSGRDNIYLNAAVLGLTKKQIEEKFEDIVKFSELERFIDQKIKNYSSGMQVRLAFSVAIHANRDILLMDEVLAVGDTNFQGKCLDEFNRYRKAGKTVLLVTHDIFTVQRYCDRALLLNNGKIIMVDKASLVIDKYIHENIVDEEEHSVLPGKEQVEKPKVSEKKDSKVLLEKKTVKINRVDIFDSEGSVKKVFRSGDDIRVSMSVNFLREVQDPIFGIIVTDIQGKSLFVTNTDYKRIKTGIFKNETVKVEFSFANVFSNGTYFVTTAVAGAGASQFFDWQDKSQEFSVINRYQSGGVVDLVHDIVILRK